MMQSDRQFFRVAMPIANWALNNMHIVGGAFAYALAQDLPYVHLPNHLDIHDPVFIAAEAARHSKLLLDVLNNLALGGGVAVAVRGVSALAASRFREHVQALSHRPAARPDWVPMAAQMPQPQIMPMWQQGQFFAGPAPPMVRLINYLPGHIIKHLPGHSIIYLPGNKHSILIQHHLLQLGFPRLQHHPPHR